MKHGQFEWDLKKARQNFVKHGIRFEQAAVVLSDPFADIFHVDEYDEEHSSREERWTTTGSDPGRRTIVLVICWTQRGSSMHAPRIGPSEQLMKQRLPKENLVKIRADQLKPTSKAELDRVERLMEGPIDTSDIPEQRFTRKGPLWHAIMNEMRRQRLTGHKLWKRSREHCPKIPESAVYEFMSNKRSVRVDYADAMLQALGLRITPTQRRRAG